MQQIADYINNSNTGSIATVNGDHVSVQVPGIGYTDGMTYQFYSIEKVRNMRAAIRLIQSME